MTVTTQISVYTAGLAPSHSLKRFMVPVDNVELNAGESRTIDVELRIPEDAEPGGYFGAVRFAPADPDTGGQVNASASVASLVLLRVNGDAPEKLDLAEFSIRQDERVKSFMADGENVVATVRFENKGRVQAGPFGMYLSPWVTISSTKPTSTTRTSATWYCLTVLGAGRFH